MDTFIEMTAYGAKATEALTACSAEIRRLEALFSATEESSDVHRINGARSQAVAVSSDTAEILRSAKELSRSTDGCFDPTVYPLVQLWGFHTVPKVPDAGSIESLLIGVGAERITTDGETVALPEGMGIDLGGIAKGYATDRLAELVKKYGVASAMFTLGGNVRVLGRKPDGSDWRIGVRDPAREDGIIGVVSISDRSVITSGSYQRYFEENGKRYHHILDPKTGYPSENGLVSVTVIADSGVRADALSTALFVMGEEAAIRYWRAHGLGNDGFSVILIREDGDILMSENAPFEPLEGKQAEVFSAETTGSNTDNAE